MKKSIFLFFAGLSLALSGCRPKESASSEIRQDKHPELFLLVLGIMQDAGFPQTGCEKECCKAYWEGKETKKFCTSLALVDRVTGKYWLFEATPDIGEQLNFLQPFLPEPGNYRPAGIFITHAHTGHYSGLMQFGKEVMGAKDIPVWAMPRLDSFFRGNGPWSQLVNDGNIQIRLLRPDSLITIEGSVKLLPFRVPHRDEYSETAGFIIQSGKKKVLFIPDIDKWEKWSRNILDEIRAADLAFLDATFYRNGELPGRNLKEIPHPFVEESMQLFSSLPAAEKAKIHFIHFNHTNPLLKSSSPEKDRVKKAGFGVAEEGMIFEL